MRTFITKLRLGILRLLLVLTLIILIVLYNPYDLLLHTLLLISLVVGVTIKLFYSLPITLILSLISCLVLHKSIYISLALLSIPYLSRLDQRSISNYLRILLYAVHIASILYYVGISTWYLIITLALYVVLSITYLIQVMSFNDVILRNTLMVNLAKALVMSFIILIIAWLTPQIQATVIFGSIAILLLLALDRVT